MEARPKEAMGQFCREQEVDVGAVLAGGKKEGGGSADAPASTRQGCPALIVAGARGCRQPTGVSSAGLGGDSSSLEFTDQPLVPQGTSSKLSEGTGGC